MDKKNFSIEKIIKRSIYIMLFLIIISLLLTHNIVYGLISLFASLVSLFGFYLTLRVLDKLFNNKGGKKTLIFVFFVKLTIIGLGFYAVSRISDKAVIFYFAGISIIVLSIIFEGFIQILTLNKSVEIYENNK